jgi:hypothetical protein
MNDCILCGQRILNDNWTFQGDPRYYWPCDHCGLVQVDAVFLPDEQKAVKRYLLHEQDAGSEGHIRHLRKALEPSLPYLSEGMTCLDYGCGPVPVLSGLLKNYGFACDNYDPSFGFLVEESCRYDFVFCLETAEHFMSPGQTWIHLLGKVKPRGFLTLMTERYRDKEQFGHWYYKRDFTHTNFYHQSTIQWLASAHSLDMRYDDGERVTVFNKN